MKTKKWAKELSLEVWEYLRDYPEITRKEALPKKLYDKIKYLRRECPLCEYLTSVIYNTCLPLNNRPCKFCPLESCNENTLYQKWYSSKTKESRSIYSGLIVDKIRAWDIDND